MFCDWEFWVNWEYRVIRGAIRLANTLAWSCMAYSRARMPPHTPNTIEAFVIPYAERSWKTNALKITFCRTSKDHNVRLNIILSTTHFNFWNLFFKHRTSIHQYSYFSLLYSWFVYKRNILFSFPTKNPNKISNRIGFILLFFSFFYSLKKLPKKEKSRNCSDLTPCHMPFKLLLRIVTFNYKIFVLNPRTPLHWNLVACSFVQ